MDLLPEIVVSRKRDTTFLSQVSSRVGQTRIAISHDVILTFSGMSHAKPSVLRAFLESTRPKVVSKPVVSCETSLKKSKKHCTRAPQNHQVSICTPNLLHLEFIRGIPGIRGIRGIPGIPGIPGSGVIECCSEPPFHTRRGSG